MATTESLIRLNNARAVTGRAYGLTAAQALAIAESSMDSEEQTFRAVVFAVANRMAEIRTERARQASVNLWNDAYCRKWLGDGLSSPPPDINEWVTRLNGLYRVMTETRVSGTRTVTQFVAVRGLGDKDATRKLYFTLSERIQSAIKRRDEVVVIEYDNVRMAGRNAGIELVSGKRASIAGNAPHWITVYDALDFSSPDVLNLTLGQVRRNQQAVTGATFGANSPKAQAWVTGVSQAAADVQNRLRQAGVTGKPNQAPPSQEPADSSDGSGIPWITILVLLAIAGAVYWYLTRKKG